MSYNKKIYWTRVCYPIDVSPGVGCDRAVCQVSNIIPKPLLISYCMLPTVL